MIVIDHNCISSNFEGPAGFGFDDTFQTSTCALSTRYFPDQTNASASIPTHACGALHLTESLAAAAEADSARYTNNDLTASTAAADKMGPTQKFQFTTMVINPTVRPTYVSSGDVCDSLDIPAQRDRHYFTIAANDLISPRGLHNPLYANARGGGDMPHAAHGTAGFGYSTRPSQHHTQSSTP